jgi:hypothetical protein
MEDSFKWRRFDELTRPERLRESDIGYYCREQYEGGYSVCSTNQAIFNYKMGVEFRNQKRWHYKRKAIEQFALELNVHKFEDVALIPAAVSKPIDHPEYDDRLVQTLLYLRQLKPSLVFFNILSAISPIAAAHSEEGTRDPGIIYSLNHLIAIPEITQKSIYIVDDVITTGGHFLAYKRLIKEKYPNIPVGGLFWARRVHSLPPEKA